MSTRIPLGLETNAVGEYQRKLNAREQKIAQAVLEDRNVDDAFEQALVISNFVHGTGAVVTAATGEVIAFNSGKAIYELYQAAIASAATIILPRQSADGLEVAPLAAGDALEITLGNTAASRAAYVVGDFIGGRKIFLEAVITIDDISDVTEMFFGWRKAEAYAADPDSYAAVAAFHIGATDDGRISITTSVSSTETVVDTTLSDWVDDVSGTGTHTLRIEVSNTGLCKFLFDDALPTVTVPGFSFTDAEVIIPFLHLNTETGDPGVSISSLKVGYV
jgi:hypothetical protein